MNLLRTSLPFIFLLSVVAYAQPRVEEPRPLARAVAEARSLLERGENGSAIDQLESALDSAAAADDRSDALVLLTEADFGARRYRAALETARRLEREYPADPRIVRVRYLHGVAAFQEGNVPEARAAFLTIADVRSGAGREQADALYWLARIHAEAGRLDSAEHYAVAHLKATDELARKDAATPTSEFTDDALYLAAWVREGRNDIDTAATLYRRVLDEFPESDLALDAQLRLGVIEARRGRYQSALTLLTSLTPRSERQREEQLFYMAESQSALERHEDALRSYTTFVREFPESRRNRPARYGAGWSQQQLGRWDDAISTYRQLQAPLDSIAAASLYQIGAIQTLRGDTAGARRTFEELVYRLPYESFSDNAYYQLGRIFYRGVQYDSARHYLNIAARQFPDGDVRLDAYYLLGESYAALGDWRNAQYSFQRTRKLGAMGELYRRALFREGVMLYRLGQFRSAMDRLREYVAEHPEGEQISDATFWLAEALYQDGTYDESERYYSAVIERFPTSTWRDEALYGLAWSRFQQRDFAGAARTFEQFLATYPEHRNAIEATIRLADSYRYLKQYDKAIAIYESIEGRVGKGPRAEEARYRLAEAFLEMGEIDRAVGAFRSLVTYYPESARRDVYAFNIGSIYNEKDMDSLAVVELKSFLEQFPESRLAPQAVFLVGDSYYNLHEFDSAYAWYYQVLDKYPSSAVVPDAMDAVRFTLDALGRGREAIAVIDTFMARNPNRLPADTLAFRKAMILFDQGDWAEAIPQLEKLQADFPKSALLPDASYQMGLAYEYLGNRDSALLFFGRTVEKYPTTVGAQKALLEQGSIRIRMKDPAAAQANYLLFIQRFPTSGRLSEARFGLAQALLVLADTVGALEQYRSIVDSAAGQEDDLLIDRSRVMMARIFSARGDVDQALSILASVVSRRMDDVAAEALLLRGGMLIGTNDLAGALAELKRLTGEFAEYTDYSEPGMLMLGDLYERLTNYQSARDTYTLLAAQTENEELKSSAMARLKKLRR